MRIIAGEWKGMTIAAPAGDNARPTTDRVKESMFNLMGVSWTGKTTVDLFAGSGALGLEALSRGADGTVFVDKHPRSIAAIQANIARCHAEEKSQIWRMDWKTAWNRVEREGLDVGWVFVDPPYAQNLWETVLTTLSASSTRIRFGIVCEHPKSQQLPEQVGRFFTGKQKTYGDISVTIYREDGEE